jgi:hypothetical protein
VTDDELIAAFENGGLTHEAFHHADHVRVAFLYLCRFPALAALQRFSRALQRFTAAGGKAHLYHETITWAFVFLIRERLEHQRRDTGRPPDWDEFAAANADLLCRRAHVLQTYYLDQTLVSELGRRIFILPDRGLQKLTT